MERSYRSSEFGAHVSNTCSSILDLLLVIHILFLRIAKSSMEATKIGGGTATPHSFEPVKALKLCYLQTQGNSTLANKTLGTCFVNK